MDREELLKEAAELIAAATDKEILKAFERLEVLYCVVGTV